MTYCGKTKQVFTCTLLVEHKGDHAEVIHQGPATYTRAFWSDDSDRVIVVDPYKDKHGNRVAVEGCTRCACGSKYWEHDKCIDCRTYVLSEGVEF